MKQPLVVILIVLVSLSGYAQSVRIQDPEFGYVWTKAQQDAAFSRTNGDFNLQEYFSDFYSKNKFIPDGFNAMVMLTFIVNKEGEAFFSKAFSSDQRIDLNPLQLKKCIDLMPAWLPATEGAEAVHFQVLLSLKFEKNLVSVRRMKF